MSTSVNVHAQGRYDQVHVSAEAMASSSQGDFMLCLSTELFGTETSDLTLFLSPQTGEQMLVALAGYLGLSVLTLPELPEENVK